MLRLKNTPLTGAIAGALGGLIGKVLLALFWGRFHRIDWIETAIVMSCVAIFVWVLLKLAVKWGTFPGSAA